MYPVLFRIGSFEVTTFGLMVALGVLAGAALLRRELGLRGLDPDAGTDVALAGALGGLLGAKLLFVAEHASEGVFASLLSRGGMSWFGGLFGGFVAGLIAIRSHRLPVMVALGASAPALAVGQAIGRIGCFLVGDDYGMPTSLPWGVAFPEGLPPTFVRVHPAQLYEAVYLCFITALLFAWRRRGVGDDKLFGLYLVLAGAGRFLLEFVRINTKVLLGLTVAQLVSLAILVAGAVLLVRSRPTRSPQ